MPQRILRPDTALRRYRVGEQRRGDTLVEVSQAFAAADELSAALFRVLEMLERHHDMVKAAFVFRDMNTDELYIEAGIGITAEGMRSRYKLGEGIIGRVVQSARPIVVPDVSQEPLFLNRASRRRHLQGRAMSFVCVPIIYGRTAIGALGAELELLKDREFDELVRFLAIVASMTAQALKADRFAESERRRLLDENTHLKLELKEKYELSNLVGTSGPMRQVYEQVAQVAHTSTTVLVRGESGTGKELIAHAIHYNSERSKKPFVKVNCAALPESLIESELFGYEKGAFTGAQNRKKGRFELADGGTLFLDEIGDLNVSTQIKLLRVLQEREFERVGGTETIKINVRLIAATNKDLELAIEERSFREDLYYRLNVFAIFVPALRERKTDIMLLADFFLSKYAREHRKSIKRISTPAIDMLVSYHWPGNVRELENTLERAVLVCDSNVIHGHHLPPTLQTAESSGTVATVALADAVEKLEKDLIQDALKSARGNRAKAARLLGSTERVVNYKIQKYNIDCARYR
ncbi:MAG: sigma 54-interacting transcriptional regulator [Gemmatimonadaceae bacterium]